jgi:alanyl-tRNA synthetase
MESREIREKFLSFFASKQHEIVASAPMVIKDDPTLMFTNAGMNQFKDIFLGNSPVKFPRIANSQKCLRVSGKHNDLEEVGVDTYHHTMFEMLGNWSFGDYFKEEAILWAWELLTEVYGIEKDRLYVTVFGGDAKDGLAPDTDAENIWKTIIAPDRILHCSKKDNFWEMGETGPCGPCSEIHVDIRNEEERAATPGKLLVNNDHPQVIEIWNLVFMQFNRMADGSLLPLPAKHIDTGMGFERLSVVLQKKRSNYDTDIFRPTIQAVEAHTGIKYQGADSKQDIAMRVIADHLRAVSFSIADGQLPSNTGAGYVIRRILRRAIRYGYSFLNINEPFIYSLSGLLASQMGDQFPEIRSQQPLVARVIREEEENFLRTLANGIQRLNELISSTKGERLNGAEVFELYDTFGFPADLTALIAAENGKTIDHEGFNTELNKQKERSRAAGKVEAGDWVVLMEDEIAEFIGYDQLAAEVRITRYREVKSKGKSLYQLVFNLSPFYPEGGGQIGDTGFLADGHELTRIIDTRKENNLIIHISETLPANPSALFKAEVDAHKRALCASNHSATHLLHQALRETLGTHVEQKGSLVAPDYLRFDFSHFGKMSEEEIQLVQHRVNELVRSDIPLNERRNVPIEEARRLGAMMLFGEKYGDTVRVINFGESTELCGGTHVKSTGKIGSFKIMSEGAVAAGVRRIEAISSEAAENYVKGELALLSELRDMMRNPQDIRKALQELIDQNQNLQKELESLRFEKAMHEKSRLLGNLQEKNGIKWLAARVDLDAKSLKDLAFQMKSSEPRLFAVLGSVVDGKPTIACIISDDIVKEKGLNAGKVVKELAVHIKGGGGGQAFYATAGGTDVTGLETALNQAVNMLD